MADDMKAVRRKRADAEVTAEPVEGTEAASKRVKKLRRYVVRPHSKICIESGVYAKGGDVVKLDSKMAKHFIKYDRISPYVEFDEDDS